MSLDGAEMCHPLLTMARAGGQTERAEAVARLRVNFFRTGARTALRPVPKANGESQKPKRVLIREQTLVLAAGALKL